MSQPNTTLPLNIREALDASGHHWEARRGTRHIKIYLGGRLLGVVSSTATQSGKGRDSRNMLAQIKRVARQLSVDGGKGQGA